MICRFREEPVGPHPVAMFEVDTFTPHETGTLFTWLSVRRGPLSWATAYRLANSRSTETLQRPRPPKHQ